MVAIKNSPSFSYFILYACFLYYIRPQTYIFVHLSIFQKYFSRSVITDLKEMSNPNFKRVIEKKNLKH